MCKMSVQSHRKEYRPEEGIILYHSRLIPSRQDLSLNLGLRFSRLGWSSYPHLLKAGVMGMLGVPRLSLECCDPTSSLYDCAVMFFIDELPLFIAFEIQNFLMLQKFTFLSSMDLGLWDQGCLTGISKQILQPLPKTPPQSKTLLVPSISGNHWVGLALCGAIVQPYPLQTGWHFVCFETVSHHVAHTGFEFKIFRPWLDYMLGLQASVIFEKVQKTFSTYFILGDVISLLPRLA